MYCSAFLAIGHSGMTTMRKMRVKADKTSVRAISLGVRCRIAPSTNAIIRSRKDWPGGRDRTTIRSESTVVPPVTPSDRHRPPE